MELSEIRIKRDGRWYANDAEMFRLAIVNIFATHLERDEEGGFLIRLGEETFPVVVEDVPFTAVEAFLRDGEVVFRFHDRQEMTVGKPVPVTFKADVPYITFHWNNDTRLSRSAFWQVSDLLREEEGGVYLIPPRGGDTGTG